MNLGKAVFLALFVFPSFCFSQKIFWPMDTVIKRCPVIIEGKIVNVTRAYWNIQTRTSKMHEPFRSYIIQVYKVFKGDLNEKYVEVPIVGGQIDSIAVVVCDGISMPTNGATGIFYLRFPPDSDWSAQFYDSGDTLAKHHVMNVYWDPYNYDASWTKPQRLLENIERNLYRHIEQITGIKRRVISTPLIDDSSVVNWLRKNHKENLNGKEGLVMSFFRPNISKDKKTLSFSLNAKSTAGNTDLNSMTIAVHYNTHMFGAYIVKNKNLEWGNDNIPHYAGTQLPPDESYTKNGYDFQVEDLDSSSFSITIKRLHGASGFMQIGNNTITKLELSIKNTDGNTGLYFANDKCKASYFDYGTKPEIRPFSYVYGKQDADIPLSYLYFPEIYKIYPDTIR